ncbi:MAG TPA: DUF3298 domain-containing protein [Ignavibacteria bacterium]|nr:DUF3298 domain-containing protein [Ignavibacteria bacterium]
MKRTVMILLAAVFLIACGKKNESTTTDPKQTSTENKSTESKTTDDGTLKFEEKKFFKSYNNCKTSDTCTYFQVNYLEAVSGKNKDKINKLLMREINWSLTIGDTTLTTIQAAADSFMTSYVSFRKEVPESAQFWYLEYTMTQANDLPKLVSLSSTISSYMGGAHPNTYMSYLNINKETGDTVSLSALFAPGFEKKLNALVDAEYRKMKNLKPGDNLADKGDLFENKIEFNYNYTVNKDGSLTFYYNPYEISAYAVGPIEVTLSKDQISGLLAADSLLK